jgi:hypothetical protein
MYSEHLHQGQMQHSVQDFGHKNYKIMKCKNRKMLSSVLHSLEQEMLSSVLHSLEQKMLSSVLHSLEQKMFSSVLHSLEQKMRSTRNTSHKDIIV